MGGAASRDVTQRDLLGTVATIYRAEGWLVVTLHQDRTNPRQQSGPDFLVLRDGVARAIKCLLSGELSAKQDQIRARYEDAGIAYVVYSGDDPLAIATDAAGGDDD